LQIGQFYLSVPLEKEPLNSAAGMPEQIKKATHSTEQVA
jgi:hypothetical protein